jgi:ribonuclease PH
VIQGRPVVDLDYVEDSAADVDMNLVMTGAGEFVEIQGTAEQVAFGRQRLDDMLALGEAAIRRLITLQRRVVAMRGERTFTL